MYWGLPCVTYKNIPHGPEIYYLKNSFNGYLLKEDTTKELKTSINKLLQNERKLQEMSVNSKKHILLEGNIKNMFLSFNDAINYCLK